MNFRSRINRSMRDRYSPTLLSLLFCGLLVLITSFTLFIPPYIGYSNDGSFDAVFKDVGLARLEQDEDDAYFNYYQRVYRIEESQYQPNTTPPALKIAVQAAMIADTLISGDNLFDMRALAGLYCLLYLPAAFILLRFSMSRAQLFTEGVIIGVLGVLILGDVSVISRFASLYPHPLILICLMYIAGMLLKLTDSAAVWPMIVLLAALAVLLSVDRYCGAAAFIFTALFMLYFYIHNGLAWRLACVTTALIIGIMGFTAMIGTERNATLTQKYNAMTRGILLKSTQPEKTLAEFDIDPRYSVLTDTYADQNYPVALMTAPALSAGFFNHYSTALVVLYYIQHPASLIGMLDAGVGASIDTRPSYSGNYEKTVGLPPKAKSPFLAAWSSFKTRSMPKTIGFLLVLIAGVIASYRTPRVKGAGKRQPGSASRLRVVMLSVIASAIIQMTCAMVYSGDAEMIQESFVMSVTNDLMVLFLVSEMLHRMNLIRQEDTP